MLRLVYVSVNKSYNPPMTADELAKHAHAAWPITPAKAKEADVLIAVRDGEPLQAHGVRRPRHSHPRAPLARTRRPIRRQRATTRTPQAGLSVTDVLTHEVSPMSRYRTVTDVLRHHTELAAVSEGFELRMLQLPPPRSSAFALIRRNSRARSKTPRFTQFLHTPETIQDFEARTRCSCARPPRNGHLTRAGLLGMLDPSRAGGCLRDDVRTLSDRVPYVSLRVR